MDGQTVTQAANNYSTHSRSSNDSIRFFNNWGCASNFKCFCTSSIRACVHASPRVVRYGFRVDQGMKLGT